MKLVTIELTVQDKWHRQLPIGFRLTAEKYTMEEDGAKLQDVWETMYKGTGHPNFNHGMPDVIYSTPKSFDMFQLIDGKPTYVGGGWVLAEHCREVPGRIAEPLRTRERPLAPKPDQPTLFS